MTGLSPNASEISRRLKQWAQNHDLGEIGTIAEIPENLRGQAAGKVETELAVPASEITACFAHWDAVAGPNEAGERALKVQLGGSPHSEHGNLRRMNDATGLTRNRRAPYHSNTSSLGSLKRLEISPQARKAGPDISFVCDDVALMFMLLGQLKRLERDGATKGLHPSLKHFLAAANEHLVEQDWELMQNTAQPQLSSLEKDEGRTRFDALANTSAFRRVRGEARSFQLKLFDAWNTTGPAATDFMKELTGLELDHEQTVFTLHPKHPGGTNREGYIYLGAPPWWAQRFAEPMLSQLWHEVLHSVVPGIDDVSHATIELAEEALSKHLHRDLEQPAFAGHDYLEGTRQALRPAWELFEAGRHTANLHQFIEQNQGELGIKHRWKNL